MSTSGNAYAEINENFKAIVQFETLSIGELEIAADGLRSLFPNDLDDTLNTELLHLKSHLAALDQNAVPHTPIDLCKWIRLNDLQCVYPNVDIALRMYTFTPATNYSAERSFSCLRRVKNYLRSTMSEERWVLRFAPNIASDGEVVREVASAREQDMEIYEKRKGHEQLDEQQS
ncbi:hypothetical protein HELRODRAFT_158421 [Helobdella robusta]|uniref:HAT C-terminal dimerisation domain-containing protein n=1 Tax=Helobdella robusta TaxID=6412 RepID=T1EMR8_HELRO|nr:hypothetical protein HELRODRAFT_158421 [Helobdella robusta]ESO12022.1 hypothetical protein HELRODRAFT_158421 [Helobdella robusta]